MGRNTIQNQATVALPVPVPPSGLFSHGATDSILSILVDNAYTAFGIRDLGRVIDIPHRSVSDAVEDLEAVDLVEVSHEGPKKLVRINRNRLSKPDDPITHVPQSEFHEPVRGLTGRLTDGLEEVHGIVLFGSVARGTADRRSDIDCFVLVEDGQAIAQQTAHEIASDLGEQRFEGERYEFQVLVESLETARRRGDKLRDVFSTGLTIEDSDGLRELKSEVLIDGR